MLAWVRTATSLITFGFSFYKFFELDVKSVPQSVIGPREFALIMISIGLLSLVVATVHHRHERTALKKMDTEVPRSQAAVLAGLIALLVLAAVLFRF
jgi:putative membrane protein